MLLSISGHSDHDLSLFSSRCADGTCSSILDESQIHAWVAHSPKTHVLWLHSRPARGKSVFSSFLVDHLRDQGASVQYFFFRSGDETKRSVGTLLRFLAFQIAGIHPVFRQALASLSDGGFKPKDTDWKSTWRKLFTGLLFKQESERPLYWVIDGLDECATPQLMLELTAELKTSLTPIRVLLTSRWSPALFTSFGRINSKVPSSWFSLDKNSTDMRIFIEEELQYLSWDDSVKDEVMSKILSQANDNFLWVRLILEEIKDCHTDDDVRYALNELPPGMESLYQRMEEAISRIRKPSDKNLSRQLLMWAVYARRPVSLDELSEVLEPESGRVLDLPTTINRLCGHFLVVEGDNRLGLLHQTTREYLMSSNGLPFSLSASNCHNELFQKSLTALMDRGVRSKVQSDSSKSLHYRATAWMHHLKAATSPSDHDGQLDLLVKFFTQPCVLAWVQLLASLSQLRTLIDAAHALDSFVKKKRRADAAREPAQRRFEDLELLDLWSRDLLKLPGKFGAILLQEPTSIHSSVAPFCPTKSAVYKTFGSLSSSPSIKGLSEDWDDCLARVSVGSEHQAVLLGCSAKHLAVADSAGFVSLWDCATFHRTRLLTLGEGISALCFSEVGDQIATYGYRATKVWNTQSGRLLNVIDNPSDMKAVTLHFADDGRTLLVGTDRRCLLKVSLQKEKGAWDTVNPIMLNDTESLEGTILGSPTALSISPDHTKVVVAYRRFPLTIWNLSPAKILKRVNRDSRVSASASPFVTSLAWHPNSEEVVGIFMDGYIFKTNVIEDTYNEQPPDPGQFPLHIRVSPDGTTFAICGVHGTIKLYDYQTSTLIYQLTSEENVADLCFSQDGRRFYDIRGSSCNIWEPNALIRLAATEEHPASSQSPEESVEQSNLASESFADNPTPIVIMSPMPHHSLICLGDDEGLVTLHDYDSGQRLRIDRIATGMAIEHLVWSGDACHFVYAEVGGRLTVVKTEKTSTGWKHQRVARFKPKSPGGGIKQLLLSPNSNFMLIGFQESAQLWSVDPPSQMKGSDEPRPKRHVRWVTHPTSSSHFLSIMTNRVSMHAWENTSISEWPIGQADLQNTTTAKPPLEREDTDGNPLNNDHIQEAVEKVVPTFYRGYFLMHISRYTSYRRRRPRYMIVGGLDHTDFGKEHELTCITLPPEMAKQVEIPMNILKNGYLVYMDRSFGVCTWHIKSSRGVKDIKRHFYIPRDWISDQNLGLLSITESGLILCPRKSDVVAISTSLGSEW
ncbi:NACHT and WD domain-containing protein [Seiridium cupressi]